MKTSRHLKLPPSLPRPFDASGRVDEALFDGPAMPADRVPMLFKAWCRALREGVPAAVTHDHALFEHLPGRHDRDYLDCHYTDSPLVSPWTPANLSLQLPPLSRTGIRALTPTVWLLEWLDGAGGLVWEVIVPSLLEDAPRAAFWAGATVSTFARLEWKPSFHSNRRFALSTLRQPAVQLELDIRQTPFGIWCARVCQPGPFARRFAQQWMLHHFPLLLHRLCEEIQPFDNAEDHKLFEVPLMLEPTAAGREGTPFTCTVH